MDFRYNLSGLHLDDELRRFESERTVGSDVDAVVSARRHFVDVDSRGFQ